MPNMRALVLAGFTLLAPVYWCSGAVEGRESAPVAVDFFFEVGCDSCAIIRRDVLPEMERRYGSCVFVREWDVGVKSNYLRLVSIQERLGVHANEPVSMLVDGREFLPGLARIRQDLFSSIDEAMALLLQAESPLSAAVPLDSGGDLLRRRTDSFTLAGIIWAAVVDSINPCAMSTLVFFMSLLSVSRIGTARMWLAGLSFLLACFMTYLAIGFGLLKALEWLTAFHGAKRGMEFVLLAVMGVFAVISFRDAWRYHRSGDAGEVSLKLPRSMQVRIHQIMRSGLNQRSLVIGGLGMGAVVTVIESVCTGQVYVPALVMMIKSGQSLVRSVLYLLLYNAIFVAPLAIVLALTCGGMGTPALVAWSRRNVTTSKVLLGMFFLAMMGLMAVLP